MTILFIHIISTILLPLYFFFHYYFVARISSGLGFRNRGRWVLGSLFFALALLSTPAFLETSHSFLETSGTPYHYAAFGWLGIAGIGACVFLCADGVRLFLKLFGSILPSPALRVSSWTSTLAGKVGTTGVLVSWLAISAYGIFEAVRPPSVERISIEIPGLTRNLTIVQLSDMHLGPVFGAERLGTVMTTVRQIRPDLIVLSGDIIDGDISARYAEEYLDSLSTLRSRHGTIAVIGNHEEYFGVNRISELYKTDSIQLMRDTLVTLGDEIEVAGVDDYGAARDLSNRRKLNNVIAGRASGLPLILLGHDPTFFEDEAERGVVLQLSGHTHGGQFVPLNILARLKFKHISGLSMHKRSYLYVSNGIGTRGPLMRLLARSEISVIQLRGPHNRP